MTQEYKELLLKEFCARLPYNVKIHIKGEYKTPRKVYTVYKEDNTITYFKDLECFEEDIENVKPYLRSMSSMTKEEEIFYNIKYPYIKNYEQLDWFNAHHFDYRGLIEKGLALEAPKDMYKY